MGLLVLLVVLGLLVLWAASTSGFLRRIPPLTKRQRDLLAKYALPYQALPRSARQRFEHTVSIFLNDKEWVGAGIDVAEEMKVMIGACAAQLLQGFPDVELMHFQRIVVYPDSYRSPRSGQLHQGEVRPLVGLIIISWEDFVHGYSLSKDAHNVGLHEMAHALWFENTIENGEDHWLRPDLLKEWCVLANAEITRIKIGEDRFFRDYAGTNQAEFFAVAVEYFFERPTEFKASLPNLYGSLAALLKQDPAGNQGIPNSTDINGR